MKWSTILVSLPVYALSASALALPPPVASHVVAGSTDQSNATSALSDVVGELELEYQKLEALKWQLFELNHKIAEQEHAAWLLLNKDFRTCSGLGCLQTALRKAPAYFRFFKNHIRHKPENATDASGDCPWSSKKQSEAPLVDSSPSTVPEDITTASLPQPSPPPLPPPPDHQSEHDRPSWHDRPPRPFPTRDPEAPFSHPPSGHDRPYHPDDGLPPPPPHPHHRPHRPFHMPHPAPRHRHFKLILATAGLVVSIFIFAILFKACRVYLSNPRVQADRAARIEECRTRREYRRAACQHRLRQCFTRFRRRGRSGSRGTGDYEEKRAMLQRRSSASQVESHIVGADINSLRRAHEIVGQLMRAEQGRLGHDVLTAQGDMTPSSSRSVRSLQTVTTLPAYAPPPPRYSQELSRDLEVVDGFRFTPSQSEATEISSSASSFMMKDDDLCTESSVVDCQSRMSMDTGSVAPSIMERSKKSLELAGDRFRGRFD